MFQPDAVYTGTVTDIGKKGDALIKVDGKVVFLPGAQLGDEVVFRVVSGRDSAAQGEVISRTPAAPHLICTNRLGLMARILKSETSLSSRRVGLAREMGMLRWVRWLELAGALVLLAGGIGLWVWRDIHWLALVGAGLLFAWLGHHFQDAGEPPRRVDHWRRPGEQGVTDRLAAGFG